MTGRELGFFGKLSFWRCVRHPWTYIAYLDDCQRGIRRHGDPPNVLRRKEWRQ